MFHSVIEDVFIDFVGDSHDTPFQAEIGYELQFLTGEDFACGVVGSVDNDRFGLVIKRLNQFLLIEIPIRFVEGDESGCGSTEDGVRSVILIERLKENDLLAGIDDSHEGTDHGLR